MGWVLSEQTENVAVDKMSSPDEPISGDLADHVVDERSARRGIVRQALHIPGSLPIVSRTAGDNTRGECNR